MLKLIHYMKQIFVLRHAHWDENEKKLTESGILKAEKLKEKLPKFTIIISSPVKRAIETAKLLSNCDPEIDKRASVINWTKEQKEKVLEKRRQNQKAGTFEAIFNFSELIDLLKTRSQELGSLIKETFGELKDNESALIISHDAVMIGSKKILQNLPFVANGEKFDELTGFIIDEKLKIKEFDLFNS